MEINRIKSQPLLQTKKNTPRKEVTEEIQGNDKAILDVKFGKDKDEVFLMGKHLKFIKDFTNAGGGIGLAAGAAIVAAPLLLGLGTAGRITGGIMGATVAFWGAGAGESMTDSMLRDKIRDASTTSEKIHYEQLFSDKNDIHHRHHGLTISTFGVMGAGIAVAAGGGLGGIVGGGIVGLVTGMIAASHDGWPEPVWQKNK